MALEDYQCQNCGFDIGREDGIYWAGQWLFCRNCNVNNHLMGPDWDGHAFTGVWGAGVKLTISYFKRVAPDPRKQGKECGCNHGMVPRRG